MYNIINGDSLVELKKFEDNSFDSIVCDPPFGWSFMGKKWDYDIPSIELWQEVLRVLKPGGHALVCCGSRTQHRMAVNLEDGGFEIRDVVIHIFASGFPKSLNLGKVYDKKMGNERTGNNSIPNYKNNVMEKGFDGEKIDNAKGTSPYEGLGTALKPAFEAWTLCRKPLSEKTIIDNVIKWNTGGLNIDKCRLEEKAKSFIDKGRKPSGNTYNWVNSVRMPRKYDGESGRFPANIILDGSDEVFSLFPNTGKGNNKGAYNYSGKEYDNRDTSIFNGDKPQANSNYNDSGSASRFFYCAKASRSEKNMGLEDLPSKTAIELTGRKVNSKGLAGSKEYENSTNPFANSGSVEPSMNHHPTPKAIKLMCYLCNLITPEGGTLLDPFMGSGSTGVACMQEGYNFVGIELDSEYCKIAEARIKNAQTK